MNKKTFISLTVAAALSIGLAGCSQSEDVADGGQTPATGKQTVTFVSGEDTTTTRTSMGGAYTGTSFPFYWEGGDKIWVNAVQADGTTSVGISSAIDGKVNGSTAFSQQPHAIFTGTDVPALPEGGSYKVRYTGTGTYTTKNSRTKVTLGTTSNANALVIPPVQTMDATGIGSTFNFGAIGDCGTATATTSSGGIYNFKLNHQAAYLILMPRWPGETYNTKTYKLKSVMVTTHNSTYLLSGRFSFDDNGIGSPVSGTNGSSTIKIATGGNGGVTLPTGTDQTQSINIVMKPVIKAIPLYCIYEVSDGTDIYYIEKIITGKSFAANTITPITANLEAGYKAASDEQYLDLITNNNVYYNYSEWDTPDGERFFASHEMGDDYNTTVTAGNTPTKEEGSKTTLATNSNFQSLPTYNQITWYLKGGCRWDSGKRWGPGSNQKGGMWFKKKQTIIKEQQDAGNTSFDATTFDTTQGCTPSYRPVPISGAPSDASGWFFLPATGVYYNASLNTTGGCYWSCTPSNDSGKAFYLFFYSKAAFLYNNSRNNYGGCLWCGQ